jgi:hypothetical protein
LNNVRRPLSMLGRYTVEEFELFYGGTDEWDAAGLASAAGVGGASSGSRTAASGSKPAAAAQKAAPMPRGRTTAPTRSTSPRASSPRPTATAPKAKPVVSAPDPIKRATSVRESPYAYRRQPDDVKPAKPAAAAVIPAKPSSPRASPYAYKPEGAAIAGALSKNGRSIENSKANAPVAGESGSEGAASTSRVGRSTSPRVSRPLGAAPTPISAPAAAPARSLSPRPIPRVTVCNCGAPRDTGCTVTCF